jgi:hypothetical protein
MVGAGFDHDDVAADGAGDAVDFGELTATLVDNFEGIDLTKVLEPVVAAQATNEGDR